MDQLAGRPELEAHFLAWAFGGDLPGDSVALALDGCQSAVIRLASDADRKYWDERPGPPIRIDLLLNVRVGCDIHVSLEPEEAEKYFAKGDPGPREAYWALRQWEYGFRVDQAIDLIKLIVDVPVAMAFSEVRIRSRRGNYSQSMHSLGLNGFPARLVGQKWSLSRAYAGQLPGLWQHLVAGPNADTLRFAVRRWGSSLQRKWTEDQLIDLWISLEGLFKRESESRANSDTVARRVAGLLKLDRQNRRLLYHQLGDSYGLRNEIAHGRTDYEENDLLGAVANTDKWLRRALWELVSASTRINTLA